MHRSTRTFSSWIGVAALGLSFTAFASDTGNDPYLKKVEVSYSDLDLTKVADARTLYTRIDRAASNVCRMDFGITSRTNVIRETCKLKAIENAVREVGHANLTAIYMERAGKRAMVASAR